MPSNPPDGALRAAFLLRHLGPERAVPVMRAFGDAAIAQILAVLPAMPASTTRPEPAMLAAWQRRAGQDAAGAARILLSWMQPHG
jgi:hypothetical protein